MFARSTTSRSNIYVVLDITERVFVVALFGMLTFNVLSRFLETAKIVNLLLLVSEGSVVLFVLLRRRTTKVSLKPAHWLIASLCTISPFLVQPTGTPPASPTLAIVCLVLMLTGLTMQIAAKLVLNRSFGMVAANRGIKIGGPYRIVRHPMYAGYLLTQIAFLLANFSLWNSSVYAFGFGLQIMRILAEEQILMQDPTYREFAAKTQYRLIPGVY